MEYYTPQQTLLPIDTKAVERKYSATFVGDFCLKHANGYINEPAAVFYQEVPPVEGYSNYFALLLRNGSLMITCGASAVSEPITAIRASDGEVLYSRYRHDFRTASNESCSIDGGRDYTKVMGDATLVQLKVVGALIEIHPIPQ